MSFAANMEKGATVQPTLKKVGKVVAKVATFAGLMAVLAGVCGGAYLEHSTQQELKDKPYACFTTDAQGRLIGGHVASPSDCNGQVRARALMGAKGAPLG